MADTSTVQPASVGEHDGWTVSSSSIDQPKPEQIVERLTDVPDDRQIEQEAQRAATEEPAEDEQGAAPATEESKPEEKKKSASQRQAELRARIAAETKAYHDARRAREFEQLEIMRLRKEREELQAKPAEKPAPVGDKPMWAKYEADGKSYEEFLDDRAEYDRQQTLALTREEQQRQREEATRHAEAQARTRAERESAAAYDKRVADAVQRHPDFLEVINKNLSDVPDSPFLVHVIQTHEQGPEVLYHLAQNPDEARVLSTLDLSRPVADAIRFSDAPIPLLSFFSQNPQELDRLNRLHPASALVALGEIKAQLRDAKDGSSSTETVSNAKAPIRPVGGGRTSAPKSSDDLPFGPDWIREENKRDRERKSRNAYF